MSTQPWSLTHLINSPPVLFVVFQHPSPQHVHELRELLVHKRGPKEGNKSSTEMSFSRVRHKSLFTLRAGSRWQEWSKPSHIGWHSTKKAAPVLTPRSVIYITGLQKKRVILKIWEPSVIFNGNNAEYEYPNNYCNWSNMQISNWF